MWEPNIYTRYCKYIKWLLLHLPLLCSHCYFKCEYILGAAPIYQFYLPVNLTTTFGIIYCMIGWRDKSQRTKCKIQRTKNGEMKVKDTKRRICLFDQEKHRLKKKLFFVFGCYKILLRHGTKQRRSLSSIDTTRRFH